MAIRTFELKIAFYFTFLFAVCVMGIVPARAVVTGGSVDTTDGTGVFGFDNVGSMNQASATYIGNGWVLTAVHVFDSPHPTPETVTFTTGTFDVDGTPHVLKNPDNSDSDLELFHVSGDVGLTGLPLATSAPTANESFTMIGNGFGRADPLTYYQVDTSTTPDTWTTKTDVTLADRAGFGYSTTAKRWGNNNVDALDAQNHVLLYDPPHGFTSVVFVSSFYKELAQYKNNPNYNPNDTSAEGTTSDFDSGGAVISGGNLIGIIDAKGYFDGQPAQTAVFGDDSFLIDISTYQLQIAGFVPEPSSLIFVGSAFVLLARRRAAR